MNGIEVAFIVGSWSIHIHHSRYY